MRGVLQEHSKPLSDTEDLRPGWGQVSLSGEDDIVKEKEGITR